MPRRDRARAHHLIRPAPIPAGADDHLNEHATGEATQLTGGWLEMHRDEVKLPDGSLATRDYLRHPGAAAVLALLDDGRVVLVRQFRYPVGRVLLELPAGKLDEGESTLAGGQRELMEETGFIASEWAYAGEIHNAAAFSTESIWLWFAPGLDTRPATPGPR